KNLRPPNMTRSDAIETVTFTSLYPNSVQPVHGIFVETRLRHLIASGRVATRVIAPVPWFPFSSSIFGRYSRYPCVSTQELRGNLRADHPRYLVLPKVGTSFAPRSLMRAALPVIKTLQKQHDFDLIDAHYFYPDGVAAIALGQAMGKPVVITARGS